MKIRKIVYLLLVLGLFKFSLYGQKTQIYANELSGYYLALDFYENKLFSASKSILDNIYINKKWFLIENNLLVSASYYMVMCDLYLSKSNSKQQIINFVRSNPTSIYKNEAVINAAEYYFNKGDYKTAIFWFEMLDNSNLKKDKYHSYMFKLALSQFKTKDYENAKLSFLKSFDSKNFSDESKYYYADILYKQSKYELSLDYFLKIKNYKKHFNEINLKIIQIYYLLKKYNQAIELGKKILIRKGIKKSYVNQINKILAYSLFSINKFKDALEYTKEYTSKQKSISNKSYYILGYIYYKLGNFKQAIDNFNKIVNLKTELGQNSYYHLAQSYLKLKDKTAAISAFRTAASMDYDENIKSKSWLYYVKISCDVGNPFENLDLVCNKFIKKYPKSEHKDFVYQCLLKSYLKYDKYEDAIALINKLKKKSHKTKVLYQKINYHYAMFLFKKNKYLQAEKQFDLAIKESIDPFLKSKALFWKSECQYNQNKYREAIISIKNFAAMPNSIKTKENNLYHYNIANLYINIDEKKIALLEFLDFIKKNKNNDELKKYLNDSYLSLADIYFSLNQYHNSVKYYDKVIELNDDKRNYALYKKAICLGLIGDLDAKVDALNKLVQSKNYSKEYRNKALFEIVSIYIDTKQQYKAIDILKSIIKEDRNKSYVSKAKLKLALIYYNMDRYDQAVTIYKEIVKEYPSTFEANQAIISAKKIYVENGKIDEYVKWIETVDFFSVSETQIDSTTFNFANKLYMDDKLDRSIIAFNNYLEKFPKGIFVTNSKFLLAEIYYKKNDFYKAKEFYNYIISQDQNKFTEQTLLRLYNIYIEEDSQTDAIKVLVELESQAEYQQNVFFAQTKLMYLYSNANNNQDALKYVDKVKRSKLVNEDVLNMATLISARSYFFMKEYDKSKAEYMKLKESKKNSIKVEYLYHMAFFYNRDKKYDKSNQIVSELASLFPQYKKWAGKSLLIMAKNYFYLKDYYQSNFIIKSILDNFTDEQLIYQTNELKSEIEKSKVNNSNLKKQDSI